MEDIDTQNQYWELLRPDYVADDAAFRRYCMRVQEKLPNLSSAVLRQVFWDHYDKPHLSKHYGHIDYGRARCGERLFPVADFQTVLLAEDHRVWATGHIIYDFLTQNVARNLGRPKMIEHWQSKGTWQTPPVLVRWPDGKLQLMEGYTRLGWLVNLARTPRPDFRLADSHTVHLLLSPTARSANAAVFGVDSVLPPG